MITKKDRLEAEAYCAEQDNPGHLQNRITELEGKITRAKDHLESAKLKSTHLGVCREIDAALKELQ